MTPTTSGPQIVLIPGVQGHWQWLRPTMRAFERTTRVVTFSLYATKARPYFSDWTRTLDDIADRAGSRGIVLVGISFGGIVASHYAAHRVERVRGLILACAPSPHWRLDERSATYLRHARLSLPFLACRTVFRLAPELRAAIPRVGPRARFAAEHAIRIVRWPFRASAVSGWIEEWMSMNLADEVRRIQAPTLVLTGEPGLDRVVPVESSLEYLTLIPHARHAILARTGHLGFLERPDEFAALVTRFVDETARVDHSGTEQGERLT